MHESFRVAFENVKSSPSTQIPQQYLTQLLREIEGPVHLYSTVCIQGARLVSFYMLLYSQEVDTAGSSALVGLFTLGFFPDASPKWIDVLSQDQTGNHLFVFICKCITATLRGHL